MATPTPTRKQHSQIKGAVPYSTDLQRRKRREARGLRSEENELRAQLAELRSARQEHVRNAAALATQPGTMNQWRSRAVLENEKRARAERINRELKDILEPQMQIRSAIWNELHPLVDKPLYNINFNDAALAELTNSLESLRMMTDVVIPLVDTSVTISFRSQRSRQGAVGVCMETRSITPMTCTVQESGDLVWYYIAKINKNDNQSFGKIIKWNPTLCDVNSVASLHEGPTSVNAVNAFRMYNEGTRMVLVGKTKWLLPNEGLLFEDQSWTVISPSLTDPTEVCVSQNYYRIEAKTSGFTSTISMAALEAQKMVFDAIGEKMRIMNQSMQDMFLTCNDLSRL
ncbi:hypothetical protein PRIC1_011735 [Phytophthora ramorum]